jgi:hypothetical protein
MWLSDTPSSFAACVIETSIRYLLPFVGLLSLCSKCIIFEHNSHVAEDINALAQFFSCDKMKTSRCTDEISFDRKWFILGHRATMHDLASGLVELQVLLEKSRRHPQRNQIRAQSTLLVRVLNADWKRVSLSYAKRLIRAYSKSNLVDFAEMPGETRESWRSRFKTFQDNSRCIISGEHLSPIKICPECKRIFIATKSRKRKFCSDDCRRSHQNAARKGGSYYKDRRAKLSHRQDLMTRVSGW